MLRRTLPWSVVAATIGWSLFELRATVDPIAYLDDGSVHEQMVRAASAQISAGHDPLTTWFPFLGLGSPQFLHYQSGPSIITGAVGSLIGPDVAYRWSLYLLWCLWPLAVYACARLFRLKPMAAAAAAALAPLIVDVPGVGYEQKAYIWIGYGVWTQLWASWTLPLSWGLTYRAMDDRRYVAPAAVAVMLTAAFHFETSYLAFAAPCVLAFAVPSRLRRRIVNALLVLGGSLLASCWIVVPLLAQSRWAAINQPLQRSGLVNGYGAGQIASWLIRGEGFDDGRFPVISLLAAIGLVLALVRWKRDSRLRCILLLACVSMALSFGRTTFGAAIDIIPGHADLFFRRFFMGVDLAALLLAGEAARSTLAAVRTAASRILQRLPRGVHARTRWVPVTLVLATIVAYLLPALQPMGSYDSLNSIDIGHQRTMEATQGADVQRLAAYVKSHGGGRVYAGMPDNWGDQFTVGYVPVFKYIESLDLDEVGYTLRTASLMTDPEFWFDEDNPGDYQLFGIKYLILPPGRFLPVRASEVMQRGPYRLLVVGGSGYLRVVDTVGSITADRSDIATRSLPFIRSVLPAEGRYLTVSFAGAAAAQPTDRARLLAGNPGRVISSRTDLLSGSSVAEVELGRTAVLVLSATYDPGWKATVDGRPVRTEMVSPALVGVQVPPGRHRVELTYVGYGWYPELFALSLLALAGLVAVSLLASNKSVRRRRRKAGREVPEDQEGDPDGSSTSILLPQGSST